MPEKLADGTAAVGDGGIILVADEDPDLADTYASWLTPRHEVRTVYSARDAREVLRTGVDVVVGRGSSVLYSDDVMATLERPTVDCRIAMVTGGTPEACSVDVPVDAFLRQPVTQRALLETAADLLPSSVPDARAKYQPVTVRADGVDARSDQRVAKDGLVHGPRSSAGTTTLGSGPAPGGRSDSDADVLSLFRATNRVLAGTRCLEEAESAICEVVTETGPYDQACFCEYTESFGSVSVTASRVRGTKRETPARRFDVDTDGPIARAVAEDAVTVRSADETATGLQELFDVAVDARPQCQIVVPIRHRETVYGVLALGRDAGRNVAEERGLLADLGTSIGNGIDGIESKRLLSADTVTNLELQVTDRADPFVDVSATHACRFVFRGVAPARDGNVTCYVHVTDVDATPLREGLRRCSAVTGHRVVDDCGETLVLEVTVQDDALVLALADGSARILDFVAADGAADVSLEVAPGVDPRTVLEAVERGFPETDLLAKRTDQRRRASTERFSTELSTALTDRQQTIIATAYNAGYYRWPRESTAEEIAEAVDLAPPTLHEHVRDAEAKLLEAYFEEVAVDGVTCRGTE
jgi:hypothetical protein